MSAADNVFEQHGALVAQLRAGTLDAPETLRERILATGPGAKRERVKMSGRRKLVLLVPVAACLAVGAALIHGAFSSTSPLRAETAAVPGSLGLVTHGSAQLTGKSEKALSYSQSYDRPATASGQYFSAAHATGSAAFSGDTSGVNSNTPLNGSRLSAPATDSLTSGENAVTIPKNRLVHADASLQVVVRSHAALTHATNQASQIVTGLGGYAQNIQYQASRSGDGNAFLDLRVPVGNAEKAIGELEKLGRVQSQQVSTQDLQQTFGKQTNLIGKLKREIAIYEQALASGSVSGSQRVDVQIHLANAEHSLTSERKARSHTVASAATAAIQLQLTTNQHGFAVAPHKRGRLGRLLHNAAGFLGLEAIIVLYALIVAGPIVLILWLGWAVRRERRRRDEKALLANA